MGVIGFGRVLPFIRCVQTFENADLKVDGGDSEQTEHHQPAVDPYRFRGEYRIDEIDLLIQDCG